MAKIAVVGAGLIGRAWAMVFARAGHAVALYDADHKALQENLRETLEAKREMFRRMDTVALPETILASSTSTIPASEITRSLAGRKRCLVAHPVNPPHLVPLVELSPAPWTAPEVVERARRLQSSVGQVPIVVKKEI